jgi:hypothetical protein
LLGWQVCATRSRFFHRNGGLINIFAQADLEPQSSQFHPPA